MISGYLRHEQECLEVTNFLWASGPTRAEEIKNLRRQAAIARGLGGGRPVGSSSLQERSEASKRMHKRNLERNPMTKPIVLRGKCYPSIEAASKELGITRYYVMKELNKEVSVE